jgi:hypothetical protein
MPYVSFSANSTSNIPGLLTLVQILWTRTLNVYFLSHKYPIKDLEYSLLQSTNIPDHKDEYLLFLNEIFHQNKLNIPSCSIEYLHRAAVGRGRAPPPPTLPEKGGKGVPPPRLGFGFKVGVGVRGSPCHLPPSPTLDLE